ncbi:MAG: PEGA domain-containing protein [Candidatus Eisenbacteria bacterium]
MNTTIAKLLVRILGIALVLPCLVLGLSACGREPSILLVIRNAENQALPGVRIVEAVSSKQLGVTDETGRVRVARRARGEILRIRCVGPEGRDFPWRFEDPVSLGDPDFAQGTRLIRAQAKSAAPAAAEGRAILTVESEPSGAAVFLNGAPRGKTPATLRDLPLERVELRLALSGYQEHSIELFLTEGEQGYRWPLVPIGAPRLGVDPARSTAQASPSTPREEPAREAATDHSSAGSTPPGSRAAEAQATPPRTESTNPAEPRPVESAPITTRETTDPRAQDERAVRAVIDQYAQALRALDIDRYAPLFTSLSKESREKLSRAFKDMKSQSVTLNGVVIDIAGNKATARFHEARTVAFKAGAERSNERDVVMDLERSGDGWRIDSVK